MERSPAQKKINPAEMCFGLNRETDERSLAAFLQLFAAPALLEALIPRLSEADIEATVDFLTRIMKKHLQEDEYHTLFLNEEK
ncbi:MAG: hypothetical protein C4531_07610 [Desulfurivibrio sp.]|nr:MAG: hypothetical protein C4531_07610 [Desulfurivibrio sp.]